MTAATLASCSAGVIEFISNISVSNTDLIFFKKKFENSCQIEIKKSLQQFNVYVIVELARLIAQQKTEFVLIGFDLNFSRQHI